MCVGGVGSIESDGGRGGTATGVAVASGGLASRGWPARDAVGGVASDALAGGGIGGSLALAAATEDGTENGSAFGG